MVLGCTPYSEKHTSANLVQFTLVSFLTCLKPYIFFILQLFFFTFIQELIEKWNVSHLVDVITTDSAANMLGIFSQPDFPSTYSSGVCFNHVLQHVVEVRNFIIIFDKLDMES